MEKTQDNGNYIYTPINAYRYYVRCYLFWKVNPKGSCSYAVNTWALTRYVETLLSPKCRL